MKSKFYIILINFNGSLDTIECLESIYPLEDESIQIIVIDNSDSDEHYNSLINWANGEKQFHIQSNFTSYISPLTMKPLDYVAMDENQFGEAVLENQLIIVKAQKNEGFAAANNIALEYIKEFGGIRDWIWLLNNDTVVAPDTIDKIKNHLKNIQNQHKENILFGTPLLEYEQPTKIQAIGGKYFKYFGITSHIGEGEFYANKIELNRYKVGYPIGASMILSTIFLDKIGLMNEAYFLFYEELDWVERAKRVGGGTTILPVFGIYHKHGKSTLLQKNKKKEEFIDLLSLRNRILFSKSFYKKQIWSVKLFILTITVFKRIISGNFDRIPKIIKLVFTT